MNRRGVMGEKRDVRMTLTRMCLDSPVFERVTMTLKFKLTRQLVTSDSVLDIINSTVARRT